MSTPVNFPKNRQAACKAREDTVCQISLRSHWLTEVGLRVVSVCMWVCVCTHTLWMSGIFTSWRQISLVYGVMGTCSLRVFIDNLFTHPFYTHRVYWCVVVNLPVVLAHSVNAIIQSRLTPLVFARYTADLHALTCVWDPGVHPPTLYTIDVGNMFFFKFLFPKA